MVFQDFSVSFSPSEGVSVHGDKAPEPLIRCDHFTVHVAFHGITGSGQIHCILYILQPQCQGMGRLKTVFFLDSQLQTGADHLDAPKIRHLLRRPVQAAAEKHRLAGRQRDAQFLCKGLPALGQLFPLAFGDIFFLTAVLAQPRTAILEREPASRAMLRTST